MRLKLLVMALMLSAGCKQQPQRQPKVSEAEIEWMHRNYPGMTAECLEKLKWGGSEALPHREDECFTFSEPKRMQGLWRNQFEGSEYCDGPRECPDAKVTHESFIWLAMRSPLGGVEDTPPGGLYAIDFIGRRSVGVGMFDGMAKNEVIVDRLLSIKEIESPPPQPTRAEIIKRMKKCEKQGTCTPNWGYIYATTEAQDKKAHVEAYLKDCSSKPICMPNSDMPKRK
jgi:hypothetical protein